jgi:SAM-dependent methyltransferase
MEEKKLEELGQRVHQLATEAIQQGDPSACFETLYAQAKGDTTQIPWAKMTPHPMLQTWLKSHDVSGEGKKALVIGCGLGDDAELLAQLGFSVRAFDLSATAIAWCCERFPHSTVNYQVADLFALDSAWQRSFDLVIESRTIQALPLTLRREAIALIAQLVAVEGTLLVITRVRETEELPPGPPWALSESELHQFQELGLIEVQRLPFEDKEVQQLCLILASFNNHCTCQQIV